MKLKRRFDNILEKYGHETLVLHSNREIRCVCMDKLTGSVDVSCPFCFGMGSIPEITRELTREQDSNLSNALSFISDTQLFGEMSIPGRFYFFKTEVDIDAHDLILDVDWVNDLPVYSGRGLYEVSHVDRKRFEDGEFTFQKVYTKTTPIMPNIRTINILERYGKQFYYLEEGGG